MNFRHPLIIGVAILFLGFVTIAAYEAYDVAGIIMLLVLIISFVMVVIFAIPKAALIDEMEVGVIFNRFNNSFSRFAIGKDPKTVRRNYHQRTQGWISFGRQIFSFNDPYRERIHRYEEVRATIPKKSQTAKGKLENVRTADGIPINISWKVSYTVDVTLISAGLEHKMARALPEHSEKMVAGRVERAIKHLVELRSIQSLYEFGSLHDQGVIQGMEQEICQRVNRQLSQPVNLGFEEIKPKDVSLGPIEMPTKVEKALELAHQRKIQTEMAAGALERLQRAVSGFSKEDVRRLSELERLRILDDKEVRSLYLSDAFVRSESVKLKKKLNGRSQSEN
ncbi:MAG: hypothetical protein CL608_16670 [Anaerolineaceae bacterium]|nr:hypothetical protein [Anaerolineaceae bacterium]